MLSTYKHYHNETLFIFTILCPFLDLGLFMSYLCDLFFLFFSIFINNLMNTDMPVFLAYFLEYVLLFLDDNVDEEYE